MFPVRSKDGTQMIDKIALEPNTDLIVSIIGYNRNKDVWGEDAEEWVPERWLGELRQSVVDAKLPAVFSHMMTFTLGPRACMYVPLLICARAWPDGAD
jgi:cytochrome P450